MPIITTALFNETSVYLRLSLGTLILVEDDSCRSPRIFNSDTVIKAEWLILVTDTPSIGTHTVVRIPKSFSVTILVRQISVPTDQNLVAAQNVGVTGVGVPLRLPTFEVVRSLLTKLTAAPSYNLPWCKLHTVVGALVSVQCGISKVLIRELSPWERCRALPFGSSLLS